jgi:hypothetical protein
MFMAEEPDWIELAKIAQANHHNRRALEWRLSLGFWTGIAAITYAFLSNPEIDRPDPVALGWGYALVLVASVAFWQLPIQRAHVRDMHFFTYYMRRAQNAPTNFDPHDNDSGGRWQGRHFQWFLGHLCFTGMFMAASWYLLTR